MTVKTVTFTSTSNGVRIKTWGRPSKAFVDGVVFQHLVMLNVQNPILIDQNYCPHNNCPTQVYAHFFLIRKKDFINLKNYKD